MPCEDNKNKGAAMQPTDASRIQSAEAKSGTGDTPADSFAARAQSAAAKNEEKPAEGDVTISDSPKNSPK
ncbi:uncharacterized protein PG998_013658 [Apiospora kogelbergensis]|uniref:SMP domain-containing protein n=1 Tax=Apiospora kogelbergensis TaxID=1337665 RepID=A0AAW0R0M7_9PEZI